MRALFLTSIAIMVAAASAPGLITRYLERRDAEPPHSTDESFAGTAEESSRRAAASSGQVAIKAGSDGHFYVDAEVNFRPVRLLVDTGATVTALRRSDAEAAGIRLMAADFAHPVATANGTTYAAEAELDSVAVDNIELQNVRAFVLPDEQLAISLLGASFLNRLARFEVADGTLIFEN